MSKALFSTLLTAFMALNVSPVFSQDLNAMNEAFNAQLNARMQASTQNIVRSNMNNPHVRQMYQVYLQQGGNLDFPSYCYRYAETGGFTPQGTQRALQTYSDINARDTNNYRNYRDWSHRNWQATVDYRDSVQDRWARQRGEVLNGQSPYINDAQGTSWQLSNTASPGQYYMDRATGAYFYMDGQGQYWMNNGQGWQAMRYQN